MSRLRLSRLIPLAVLTLGAGFAALPASAATSGTFSTTGTMTTARIHATATLLPDGQVLVAGGDGTSTELYNPAAGTWAVTGSMTTGRSSASATLLPDGEVLVAGGQSAGGSALSSAELYNPATGTWTRTGSLTTAREEQSATLLPGGKVLVAGGLGASGGSLSSAELYNPVTGTFTRTGSMTTPRATHDATLLPDGDVLVTAGVVPANGVFSELYHPATGQWSAATSGLGAQATCSQVRECLSASTATLLGTGNVLVAGGLTGLASNPGTTTSAMLYHPATNTWTPTGPMSTSRMFQTATLLPDGQVLVAGGTTFGSHKTHFLASAELYTP